MRIKIYTDSSKTILENSIIADESFARAHYPDRWEIEPEPTPEPVVDPCEWLIDIGPFYDRFGAAKMAVLTSADAGVKAILEDVKIRKWIDLQRADVASSLAYIGTKVPALDSALQTAILTTPVAAEENLALRKLYFS
jgi:hypothetical protein